MKVYISRGRRDGAVVSLSIYSPTIDGDKTLEYVLNFYHGNRFDISISNLSPNDQNPASYVYLSDILFYVDSLLGILNSVYESYPWKVATIDSDEEFYLETERFCRQVKMDFYQFLSKKLGDFRGKNTIKWGFFIE